MTLKITSQNFTIPEKNIELTLNALTEIYPNKIDFPYEQSISNLQFFLWNLGFHCRVWPDGTIQTISVLYDDSPKIEKADPIKTLECLSTYMTEDSYITVNIDDNEQTFKGKREEIKDITNTTVPSVPSVNDVVSKIKEKQTETIEQKIISRNTRKRNKRISAGHADNEFKEIE